MSQLPSAPLFYKKAPFNEKNEKYMLLAVQKGLLEAQRAGDLDALHFNFPVIITEHVAPGHDPNNPNGVYEASMSNFPSNC